MNVGVTLIVLAIILVAVAVEWKQVQEIFSAGLATVQATNVASAIGISPKAGQYVCDLKIGFNPQLVSLPALGQSLGTTPLGINAGWQLQGAQYSWQNCHNYGTPLSLVPWPYGVASSNALVPADILLSSGGTVHIWLTVTAPDGSIKSYQSDPFCTQFCTTAQIPAGAVFVPKQYAFTFVITNIPKQSYTIGVTSEYGFNGNSAGQSYVQQVS